MKKSLLLLLLVYSQCLSAQDPRVAKLDSFFNALDRKGLAMGNVSIAHNGKIVYQRAVGYAYIDSATKIPATVNTRYRIGSETKMFTAVAIFRLIEEGKLRLDEKLSTYFPALPNAGKISISHLLNHRSGLHNYTEGTNFPDWMDKPTTHEQLLKIITEKGSDFEPGAKAEYSNTNYLLLGCIVEKITGLPYEKVIDNIASRAGLTNTYYGSAINISKGESASYKYAAEKWNKQKETDLSIHAGAGALVSTTGDMVKFMEALFTHRLVSKSSLHTMTAMTDGYGMGLFPFNYSSRPAFGHNGRIEEFYTSALYFPAEKLAMSYITNGILYPRADIIEAIFKTWFKERVEAPFSKPITLRPEDLDQYLGSYTSAQMQITVNCTKKGNKLLLETRGTVFETDPVSPHYFMHAATGYFFQFFPEKNELLIKETDNIYHLKRSK